MYLVLFLCPLEESLYPGLQPEPLLGDLLELKLVLLRQVRHLNLKKGAGKI